jgi:hypothetical protein
MYHAYGNISVKSVYRAVIKIQARVRCYLMFKRLNLLIKLRVRAGRRSFLRYYFRSWLYYNTLCRRIKEALEYILDDYYHKCFYAWKTFAVQSRQHKEEIAIKFAKRLLHNNLISSFQTWTTFVNRIKYLRTFLRRMLSCPVFETWVKYTKREKFTKKLNRSATVIAAFARMIIKRMKFLKMKRATATLEGL